MQAAINDAGADDTILRGSGMGTAVSVSGAPVSLQHLRITGGNNSGSGIRNSGTLTLIACTVTGNTTNQFSGGGTVNLANDQNVTGNTPDNCGGADLPPQCMA